jgi:hypothetical protein
MSVQEACEGEEQLGTSVILNPRKARHTAPAADPWPRTLIDKR